MLYFFPRDVLGEILDLIESVSEGFPTYSQSNFMHFLLMHKTSIISSRYSENWPQGYKTFFVLNSIEHEILNAHKYINIKKFVFLGSDISLKCYFSRS